MDNGFYSWCNLHGSCTEELTCRKNFLNCDNDSNKISCETPVDRFNCGGCEIVCDGDTPHCVGEGFPNTVYHCGNL